MTTKVTPLNPWHQAVLNECMSTETCYVENDPEKSINNLIDWHLENDRFHRGDRAVNTQSVEIHAQVNESSELYREIELKDAEINKLAIRCANAENNLAELKTKIEGQKPIGYMSKDQLTRMQNDDMNCYSVYQSKRGPWMVIPVYAAPIKINSVNDEPVQVLKVNEIGPIPEQPVSFDTVDLGRVQINLATRKIVIDESIQWTRPQGFLLFYKKLEPYS